MANWPGVNMMADTPMHLTFSILSLGRVKNWGMRNNNPIKTVIINHFLMFSTKIIATLLLFTLFTIHINAQSNPTWKGKKAAVVLTYDDAIDQHLDHAVPVLDALGLKATFY